MFHFTRALIDHVIAEVESQTPQKPRDEPEREP
jgi:hypothetical protein